MEAAAAIEVIMASAFEFREKKSRMASLLQGVVVTPNDSDDITKSP
jgi:hypothetical protein